MTRLHFILMVPFLFALGCASKPIAPTTTASAEGAAEPRKIGIDARVQLQDRVQKKTYVLTVDAVAVEPSKLKLTLTGPFGTPMGKVVMRGENIGLLIPQQKKAYLGTASENSFRPVLPLHLHPQTLVQLLFGDIPKEWTCEKKSETQEICQDTKNGLTLERDPRLESKQGKWTVTGEKFAMTLLPNSVSTNVQIKPDTFSMPIPEGYSKHKLP